MTRFAKACLRWGTWFVAVLDEHGWCYMCDYNEEKQDWLPCKFNTQEEAEKAAEEYTEFWKER